VKLSWTLSPTFACFFPVCLVHRHSPSPSIIHGFLSFSHLGIKSLRIAFCSVGLVRYSRLCRCESNPLQPRFLFLPLGYCPVAKLASVSFVRSIWFRNTITATPLSLVGALGFPHVLRNDHCCTKPHPFPVVRIFFTQVLEFPSSRAAPTWQTIMTTNLPPALRLLSTSPRSHQVRFRLQEKPGICCMQFLFRFAVKSLTAGVVLDPTKVALITGITGQVCRAKNLILSASSALSYALGLYFSGWFLSC
jgi:hypothetical protein